MKRESEATTSSRIQVKNMTSSIGEGTSTTDQSSLIQAQIMRNNEWIEKMSPITKYNIQEYIRKQRAKKQQRRKFSIACGLPTTPRNRYATSSEVGRQSTSTTTTRRPRAIGVRRHRSGTSASATTTRPTTTTTTTTSYHQFRQPAPITDMVERRRSEPTTSSQLPLHPNFDMAVLEDLE